MRRATSPPLVPRRARPPPPCHSLDHRDRDRDSRSKPAFPPPNLALDLPRAALVHHDGHRTTALVGLGVTSRETLIRVHRCTVGADRGSPPAAFARTTSPTSVQHPGDLSSARAQRGDRHPHRPRAQDRRPRAHGNLRARRPRPRPQPDRDRNLGCRAPLRPTGPPRSRPPSRPSPSTAAYSRS